MDAPPITTDQSTATMEEVQIVTINMYVFKEIIAWLDISLDVLSNTKDGKENNIISQYVCLTAGNMFLLGLLVCELVHGRRP